MESIKEIIQTIKSINSFEQRGSGMSHILKTYDESSIYFTENHIRMTLPKEQASEQVTEQDIALIKVLEGEIAKKLNISVRSVEYNLSKLKELGLIRRKGFTKKGVWVVG